MPEVQLIKRALISCTDKTNLNTLAEFLHQQGVEIFSTGGTSTYLRERNIPVTDVSQVTGNPEAFGGRMKTISFQISSGILFRRDHPEDVKQAQQLGISPIDLVVSNLYPFEKVAHETEDIATLVENIDIGGPLMIRAAAKNFAHVAVLTDPAQYPLFLDELRQNNGGTSLKFRRRKAAEAFDVIAKYDVTIANTLNKVFEIEARSSHFFVAEPGPELRYGENPHQQAKIYKFTNCSTADSLLSARIHQGKTLSYNNFLDADSCWKLVSELSHTFPQKVSAVVVKHGNPCGVFTGVHPTEVLTSAWEIDATSAFGGVIAVSTTVTVQMAQFFQDKFIEVLMAPHFETEALEYFREKKNVRLIELPLLSRGKKEKTLRTITGGLLIQDEDELLDHELTAVTDKKWTSEDRETALFGVICGKYTKSNAIVLARRVHGNFEMAAAGQGQTNRIDSFVRLALPRLKQRGVSAEDCLLVSEAFFPFADIIEAAAQSGIQKVVQPGGSQRDPEVIAKANELGVAMAFTGRRHFRH